MKTGFLTDAKGKSSHTRLLVMLCVPFLVLLPLGVWAAISVAAHELREIPLTITGYLGAANTIILGYAVHNKREESKTSGQPAAAS